MPVTKLFALVFLALFNALSFGRSQNRTSDDSIEIIEKVYLHTDRSTYYPGDDIWFKAYLIDASERLLSDHSMNLHVELISSDLKIIDNHIVRLNNGIGNGDFHLSEKIQSGRYRLRAYTNYMRNFGDQLFFNKDITIINSADAVKALSDSINSNKNNPEISLFPEGGSLVDNVTSKVAFKAVDGNGYAKNVSGRIYSSKGEMVCEFKSAHKGMGTFLLTPVPGLKYFAFIQTREGDSLKYELPNSFSTGVVLAISENRKNELAISFRTNSQTLSSVLDRDLSLTVSARNTPLKTYSFRMKSLNSFLNLPTNDIPDGIVMLTLSGADNIPLCERLVYIHNNDEVNVKVEAEKSEYKKRDSVSVKISLLENSTSPHEAFLSFSATDDIFTDSSRFPSNISSWFLLESDIKGPVEEPSYYFDASNPERLTNLDLLLLTQGWRDFKWKYKNNFETENGFIISGRVRKKLVNEPLDNATVTIGLFEDKKPKIYLVPIDSSGRFLIEGIDFTGRAILVASVTNDKDKLKGWLILDSISYIPEEVHYRNVKIRHIFEDSPLKTVSKSVEITDPLKYNKSNKNKDYKNPKKRYKLSDTIDIGEVIINPKPKFEPWNKLEPYTPKRQNEINLRTLFSDREIILTPDLEIYNTLGQLLSMKLHIYYNDSSTVKITGGLSSTQMTVKSSCNTMYNPLTMLDGLEAEGDAIDPIPLRWVERIDILCPIKGELEWGVRGSNGVVSILLKSDWSSTITKYNSVNKSITGYNEPRVFYSPKHHTSLESDYKPDLRTTLFWEPNIKIGNNKDFLLNYYNADNSTKIKIIVEGITSNGIPVTGMTEYEVN